MAPLDQLAGQEQGPAAIEEFFTALIHARCQGPYARWGCMVSKAHIGFRATGAGTCVPVGRKPSR
jgi:hypothetical protein